MAEHPFDRYDIQLPGRLLALETLLAVALRQIPGAAAYVPATEQALAQLEAAYLRESSETNKEKTRQTFNVARMSLERFAAGLKD